MFYEIHPTRFPDSNVYGFGDLRGLSHRIEYLKNLGVVGVRLNSIFPMKNQPNHFQNITSLFEIDEVLGTQKDLTALVHKFHENNLRLVLDLPIYPLITKLDPVATTIEESTKHPMIIDQGQLRVARAPSETNTIIKALHAWTSNCNVDGFYIKGLENLYDDPLLLPNIRAWKKEIGDDRILMINNQLLEYVKQPLAEEIIKHVDLVDIFIDVTNSTQEIAKQINQHLNGVLKPGNGAFIQWSIGGVSEHETQKSYELTTNGTMAATLMSLMLPGSPNVYHGDGNNEGKSQQQFSKPIDTQQNDHVWNSTSQSQYGPNNSTHINANDLDTIRAMINLRDISPSIYLNKYKKKDKYESNTSATYLENGNILILIRWYPRRNTFASISNFGTTKLPIDLTNLFYSGHIMIGGKAHEKIYFDRFEIGPSQTIVVKLDK